MFRYACIGVAAFALAGCGTSTRPLYTARDVQKAFTRAGFRLGPAVTEKGRVGQRYGGTLFSAKAGREMFVIVFEDTGDADAAYRIEHSQAATDSFDWVTRNVLVTTDGLSSDQRGRVRTAIAALSRSV